MTSDPTSSSRPAIFWMDRHAVVDDELEVKVGDARAGVALARRRLADVAPAASEAEVAALDRVEQHRAVDPLGRHVREGRVALELGEPEIGPQRRDHGADQVGQDVLGMVQLDVGEVARVAGNVGDEHAHGHGLGQHTAIMGPVTTIGHDEAAGVPRQAAPARRRDCPSPPIRSPTTPADVRAQRRATSGGRRQGRHQGPGAGRRPRQGRRRQARRIRRRGAAVAAQILGMDIKGTTVRRVLVAPAADIVARVLPRLRARSQLTRACCSWARPRAASRSRRWPQTRPEAIMYDARPPAPRTARLPGARAGASSWAWARTSSEFVAIAKGLYATMIANDADLVEINPLAIVRTTAADGTVDADAAVPRRQGHD